MSGGLYEAFCVVNYGYNDDDFVKLGVELCRKFENKPVLITFPVREKVNQRRLIEKVGKVYNGKGQFKENSNLAFLLRIQMNVLPECLVSELH